MLKKIKTFVAILTTPILNVLLLVTVILILLGFYNVEIVSNKINVIALTSPHYFLIILGVIPFALIVLRVCFGSLDSCLSWVKETKKVIGGIKVSVINHRLEDFESLPGACAVVLPANASFTDDCITDKRSALGAFALSKFPGEIEAFKRKVHEILTTSHLNVNSDGNYPAGTALVIPKMDSFHYQIVVSASTIRNSIQGITSDIQTIAKSIEQIFSVTTNQRIGALRMPLLGCGHGGVDPKISLFVIVLAIAFYSKKYHHIKQIEICVLDKKLACLANF